MGVNSLPKTVTRQRRNCDLNLGLLRLSPARYPLGYRATPTLGKPITIWAYRHSMVLPLYTL